MKVLFGDIELKMDILHDLSVLFMIGLTANKVIRIRDIIQLSF